MNGRSIDKTVLSMDHPRLINRSSSCETMKLADEFASLLHREYLKPLGFKKVRRTFSREHEKHVERYQMQGSQWNSSDEPWVFYLNCGITFLGLPRRVSDIDFPHAHASTRAGAFSDLALPQYGINSDNMTLMAESVRDTINEVSQFFLRRVDHLKISYLNKRYLYSFLDDVELNERIQRRIAAKSTSRPIE